MFLWGSSKIIEVLFTRSCFCSNVDKHVNSLGCCCQQAPKTTQRVKRPCSSAPKPITTDCSTMSVYCSASINLGKAGKEKAERFYNSPRTQQWHWNWLEGTSISLDPSIKSSFMYNTEAGRYASGHVHHVWLADMLSVTFDVLELIQDVPARLV